MNANYTDWSQPDEIKPGLKTIVNAKALSS